MASIASWKFIAFAAAMLPGIVLALLLFRLGRKTFRGRLFGLAIGGGAIIANVAALAGGIVEIFYLKLDPFWKATATAFISAGLFEETVKLLVAVVFVMPYFARRGGRDLVLATAATALGFALLENVFYVLKSQGAWQGTAFGRAILAVPGHFLNGLVLGHGLARAERLPDGQRQMRIFGALLLVAFLHGAYDWPLFLGEKAPRYPGQVNAIAASVGLDSGVLLGLMFGAAVVATCFAAARAVGFVMSSYAVEFVDTDKARGAALVHANATGVVVFVLLALIGATLAQVGLSVAASGALVDTWLHWINLGVMLLTVAACIGATNYPAKVARSWAGVLRAAVSGGPDGRSALRWAGVSACVLAFPISVFFTASLREGATQGALLRTGLAYSSAGQFDRAIVFFDALLAKDGSNAAVLAARSFVNLERRRNDLALADATRALEIKPDVAGVLAVRARVLAVMHDLDGALADLRRAVELEPGKAEYLTMRASVLTQMLQFEAAANDLDKALKLEPRNAQARVSRAHLAEKMDDAVRANKEFDEALRIDPLAVGAWSSRGRLKFRQGDFPGAAADLARAASIANEPYVLLWLAAARARTGVDGRDELAQFAVRGSRTVWPAPLIEFYLGRKELDEALAAASDNDQKCEADFYVGQWLAARGRGDEALARFKSAFETCPSTFVEYEGARGELQRAGVPVSARGAPPEGAQASLAAAKPPVSRPPLDPPVGKTCRAVFVADTSRPDARKLETKFAWALDEADKTSPVARAEIEIAGAPVKMSWEMRAMKGASGQSQFIVAMRPRAARPALKIKSVSRPFGRPDLGGAPTSIDASFMPRPASDYRFAFTNDEIGRRHIATFRAMGFVEIPMDVGGNAKAALLVETGGTCGVVIDRTIGAWLEPQQANASLRQSIH